MFIRTKNKIYEVESKKLDYEGKWVGYNIVGNPMIYIIKDQVINQSDNLAELCDEFVIDIVSIETKEKYHWIYDDYSTFKGASIKEGYKGNKYGAIWTNKGLIYIAKMNDKGELELI